MSIEKESTRKDVIRMVLDAKSDGVFAPKTIDQQAGIKKTAMIRHLLLKRGFAEARDN
ncbi:hypothetical protein [Methylacidiphilum sp. Yel]|jgi:hypothetical protein|uniref:hypothetical protein n=1 Tax=Methylacidiphilum sp. Yel TaxID=1847730 RepID=UPI00141B38D8|nr:hypothetical protein [Methylacidiphilum sp. Yel]